MEITIGSWIVPLAISVAVWLWATLTPSKTLYGQWPILMPDVIPLIRGVVAVITTLAVWLIWALTQI